MTEASRRIVRPPMADDSKSAAEALKRGDSLRERGDLDGAIAAYTEASRLDLRLAVAYHNRGVAYEKKGDHGRAIADFAEALRLDPNDAEACDGLGIAHYRKGDLDNAIAFSEAIRLNPNLGRRLATGAWPTTRRAS